GMAPSAIPETLERASPYWLALAPYLQPGSVTPIDDLAFFAGCLILSGMLAWLAVARLRPVHAARAGRRASRRASRGDEGRWRRWLPGPSLDFNPVLWREWHRARPSRWARAAWLTYVLLAVAYTATVLAPVVMGGTRRDRGYVLIGLGL